MESIKEVLMRRDEMSAEEAEELIKEAKADLIDRIDSGESMLDIMDSFCADWFGLEQDYLQELIY